MDCETNKMKSMIESPQEDHLEFEVFLQIKRNLHHLQKEEILEMEVDLKTFPKHSLQKNKHLHFENIQQTKNHEGLLEPSIANFQQVFHKLDFQSPNIQNHPILHDKILVL